MKKRFANEPIIGFLRHPQADVGIKDLCRRRSESQRRIHAFRAANLCRLPQLLMARATMAGTAYKAGMRPPSRCARKFRRNTRNHEHKLLGLQTTYLEQMQGRKERWDMYKALILGCGSIGAMYDYETESISTYAKAFHLDSEIEFDVYDTDPNISRRIAERYDVRCLNGLSQATYQNYDIIVISTPTATHHEYLSRILKQSPRLVICEKPVDIDRVRLNLLAELYRKANTKVMVNYFRRFQPGVIRLKQHLESILRTEPCTNILVTYQRGFHNNASHAVDLLEFLFSSAIDFDKAQINYSVFDEFDADPTLSASCVWNGANLQFIGLAHAEFSHFEVGLYFSKKALLLKDGANVIEEFSVPSKKGNFYPELRLQHRQTEVLDNYMINVVSHAKCMLKMEESRDNFLESVSISERILKLLGR